MADDNGMFAVPGARLRYRDEGAGRAVVFVHGWTLDLEMWEPQSPLAAELRLVRYDRRGFGLSTGLPSLAEDVADLRALIGGLLVILDTQSVAASWANPRTTIASRAWLGHKKTRRSGFFYASRQIQASSAKHSSMIARPLSSSASSAVSGTRIRRTFP